MSKRVECGACRSCLGKRTSIIDAWPCVSVECANPHCRARGPIRPSETEAIRAWNDMGRPRGLKVMGVAR